MSKLSILVCAHKQDPFLRREAPFLPVHAGKALHPEVDLGIVGDDEGDNISDRNPRYCELTALYWGWKNLKDVKYAGLAHYRRYLDIDINDDNVDSLMKGCDIIVGNREVVTGRILQGIVELTSHEDTYIFFDTLLKHHPEYMQAILEYCCNSNAWYKCTMFIARKELYDRFCETFFPVFFETETRLRTYPFSRQNRVIAYFGELSLGLFIVQNRLKTKTVPILAYPLAPKPRRTLLHPHLRFVGDIKTRLRILGFRVEADRWTGFKLFDSAVAALKADGVELKYLK